MSNNCHRLQNSLKIWQKTKPRILPANYTVTTKSIKVYHAYALKLQMQADKKKTNLTHIVAKLNHFQWLFGIITSIEKYEMMPSSYIKFLKNANT